MTQWVPATLGRGVLEIRLDPTEKNNTPTPAMHGALADAILDGDRAARALDYRQRRHLHQRQQLRRLR